MTALPQADLEFVRRAARTLERPGFLIRAADVLGRPVEALVRALPERGHQLVARAVETSLRQALRVALSSLTGASARAGSVTEVDASGRAARAGHDLVAAAAGAAGGFFGLAGLVVELPFTTTLLLRSVARIAADFGEDLSGPEARMECLAVFSHGGRGGPTEAMESSFYLGRAALSRLVQEAAAFTAGRTAEEIARAIAGGSAPALVRLLSTVAARYGVVVTEKALAEAVPVIGAVGGATLNLAFADHFNSVARAHFGLRRLEREHGVPAVATAVAEVLGRPERTATAIARETP